ncbi:CHAD domain-containing protein [Ruegeria sediminis]|uniref:CHAD domain-containing protein n=1 Tax=Ruegeria sediminis TaxID=2583820 RepID=A0ABY2WVA6_9RHOB|nr:CHAD domain-containing protein [Ruegeria sediminis]TMV06533.1 CHAD domain-containing protein [Ruegeria sediminis]
MKRVQGRMLVVPGTADFDALGAGLGKLRVKLDPPAGTQPFALLDCFDQSLRQSGRVLLETGGELHLLGDDGLIGTQPAERPGNFVADLAPGPVRKALADFPALRALMPVCEGQFEKRELALLDQRGKVRAGARITTLRAEGGAVTLVALRRAPDRGKDGAALEEALSELGGRQGISPVWALLMPDAQPYEATPDIALGKREPAFQAANDIIRTYLNVARRNEGGVIADIDTEFLHDYRVSLRRIRSVLSLFKGVYSPDQAEALKQDFSAHMAATGRLRDLDVYLLEQDKYFELLPESLHDGLRVMFDRFRKERTAEQKKMVRRLRSKSYGNSISELVRLFERGKGPSPGQNAELGAYDYACRLIWKRYRKVCKLARSITDDTPDADVHHLRIQCKKLRYLMEFFAPLFDEDAFKTIIKPLKRLQNNLGAFNDYTVQQGSLMALLESHSDSNGRADASMAMAVGGLIAILNQRQWAERARVVDSFSRFDRGKVQRVFRRLFRDRGIRG